MCERCRKDADGIIILRTKIALCCIFFYDGLSRTAYFLLSSLQDMLFGWRHSGA